MKKLRIPKEYINTFSIVGFDPETGELGVAVASKFLAAAALVPFAKAGVGAVATQAWMNVSYGYKGIDLMKKGLSADEAMNQVIEEDDNKAVRQVGFVDTKGNSATFTGDDCHEWAGGIAGKNYACQGNILVGEETVKAMAEAFESSPGDLATRLLAALQAGDNAGGDQRGKQSAGILVVKENGGYGGHDDRYIDLRVDDHEEPVKELVRIHQLHQLYFKKSEPKDILKIEGKLKEKLIYRLKQLNYLQEMQVPTDQNLFEALHTFQLIENFDERIQEKGYVDRKVVEFMESLLTREE